MKNKVLQERRDSLVKKMETKFDLLKNGHSIGVYNGDRSAVGRYYLSGDGELCREFQERIIKENSIMQSIKVAKGKEAFYSFMLAVWLREKGECGMQLRYSNRNISEKARAKYTHFCNEGIESVINTLYGTESGGILDDSDIDSLLRAILHTEIDLLGSRRDLLELSLVDPNEELIPCDWGEDIY